MQDISERTENNISHFIPEHARSQPGVRAVVFPCGRDGSGRRAYTHYTFAQLDSACDRFAWGLTRLGVQRGTRVLLMVRPSLDFFAMTFAIFKIGAIPVLIDPGMGWRRFMHCVAQAEPETLIGIPAAQVLCLLNPGYFRSVRIKVTLGRRLFWGGLSLDEFVPADRAFPVQPVASQDTAAILFTTGSTGPAKGVTYTHEIFRTQTEVLRREYGIGPGDIDLPCFPLFGLFSTALGACAVIPDMDPSRPASVNPERIIEPILDHGITYSFGSPTLWSRVGAYCRERGIVFPTLKRIIMAGAPVPEYVHERLLNGALPAGAETYTPYGATESLPVANFRGREMLAETAECTRKGHGMCVGRPLPEVTVRMIEICDTPIANWEDVHEVPEGCIGEICVRGAIVTRSYDHLPEATRLAKIADGEAIWHRMGDVGYFDEKGRIWFCGRKSHRVITSQGTLYTVCCEAIINEHPDVYRSAMVGVGPDRQAQTPVIVIEPRTGCFPKNSAAERSFRDSVRALAAASEITRPIHEILFHRSFPVDIRHNAKIRREVLAEWAGRKLQGS